MRHTLQVDDACEVISVALPGRSKRVDCSALFDYERSTLSLPLSFEAETGSSQFATSSESREGESRSSQKLKPTMESESKLKIDRLQLLAKI